MREQSKGRLYVLVPAEESDGEGWGGGAVVIAHTHDPTDSLPDAGTARVNADPPTKQPPSRSLKHKT